MDSKTDSVPPDEGHAQQDSVRTRDRKPKKVLSEGTLSWEAAEGALEGAHRIGFDINEILDSEKYAADFVKTINGRELNISFLQREGYNNPLFVPETDGLGIKVPTKNFGVGDVRAAVGSRRIIDVMDVNTQKNFTMTMKDWHKYWDNPEKTQVLNVISLEFSSTKLDYQVNSPRIVRQIDWIDKVWPRHMKEMQIEATNSIDDMMYPKVQKYCLMSVKGCYTDFHVDLGGTSVWYHLLQGSKIFWLIPPTDNNLKKYEDWVLSGKQSEVFFGDTVEHCCRVELKPGNTFFIPGGWIHAVYTREDSIVFGGNFLHSFAIEKQLQVAYIEEVTHVPPKFRFPFFTEMLWYVLDRYIHCLMGHTHLDLPEDEKRRIKLEKGENVDPNKEFLKVDDSDIVLPKEHVHLTTSELHGLKFIIMYLHQLPASKKNVPIMLPNPIAVIKDIRELVLAHKNDDPEQAVTGKHILRWNENDDVDTGLKRKRLSSRFGPMAAPSYDPSFEPHELKPAQPMRKKPGPKPGSKRGDGTSVVRRGPSSGNRRRRVRCKACEACLGGDCRQCVYCKDMVKYGGPGRMKQTCEKRRCLHPQLPVCAFCSKCQLDGWYNIPKVQTKETERPDEPPELFECTVCLDIVHPKCVEAMGKINPDLSNSWECARCVNSGFTSAPSRKRKTESESQDTEEKKPKEEG